MIEKGAIMTMGTVHSQKIRRWSTWGDWLSICMEYQGPGSEDQVLWASRNPSLAPGLKVDSTLPGDLSHHDREHPPILAAGQDIMNRAGSACTSAGGCGSGLARNHNSRIVTLSMGSTVI